MSNYTREKPDTAVLIDQGHGYVIVRRVKSLPTVSEEPERDDFPPDVDVEEGYVKASVEKRGGQYVGVYELDEEERTAPLDKLHTTRPVNLGVLL